MILVPRRLVCILVEVARRDVVMLTLDHPAKAGEVAFHLIGADAEHRIAFRVIDPLRLPTLMQGIPMGGFVGVDHGEARHNALGDLHALALVVDHEGERAALALPQGLLATLVNLPRRWHSSAQHPRCPDGGVGCADSFHVFHSTPD